MKRKLSALSERYAIALGEHLKQRQPASLEPARALGRQAAVFGLETLDVARMHENALATLETSASRDGIIGRAGLFFAETLVPIEQTHRDAVKASARVERLNKKLARRTMNLAASNLSLKQGIAQRKVVEAQLKKGAKRYKELLKESLAMQRHLQRLTHRILWAQEGKRKKIGRELRDEIAQTLLGIHVRLLTLEKRVSGDDKGLQNEIVSTQRLVNMSVKTIEQFAREYGKHQGT